eukprot:358636-Chlamydomonas_euryale.AAC.2
MDILACSFRNTHNKPQQPSTRGARVTQAVTGYTAPPRRFIRVPPAVMIGWGGGVGREWDVHTCAIGLIGGAHARCTALSRVQCTS